MRPCEPGPKGQSNIYCAPGWNESSAVLLLRAGTHCHSPTCISQDLIIEQTGELLCRSEALYGKSAAVFDEEGYAASITPCIYGYEDGLQRPPRLTLDTTLLMVKRSNATTPHWGVMAQWQMRGAWEHSYP